MPRLGVKIKRRSGRTKVIQKSKPLRKFKNKFVRDAEISKVWNHRKTMKQNYENLGIASNPNSIQSIKASISGYENHDLDNEDQVQLYHVPDSDFLNERNGRKNINHMSVDEQNYLRPLIAKYGENFKNMERDIKLNNRQWTENKLKKRCARLLLLDANLLTHSKIATDE